MGYSIVLFLHILGALALFMGLGLEWSGIYRLRRAATGRDVLASMHALAFLNRVYPASMVTILASGLYLVMTRWGQVWWGMFAMVGMVLMFAVGRFLAGGRMRALRQASIEEGGPLTPAVRRLLHDRILWLSIQVRVALAVGVVYLMTVKPGLVGSAATLLVSLMAGLSASRNAQGGELKRRPA